MPPIAGDEIKTPVSRLNGLLGSHNLHCDIVVDDPKVGDVQSFAETIGGNVLHTVRRRCYPLNAQVS